EEKRAWGDDVVIFPPGEPPADYVAMIEAGLKEAQEAVAREQFGLVILDELNVSLFFGLAKRESVESFIDSLPKDTELVITGRNAPEWLIERADLVTEMKEIKHYYTKGVEARRGIEN
ncbi:MAG: cob(I)yrinic acid a,c-diamide adenosyltransferase, partial [Schwartzia sp.]|nr:cob(I)yrinic acid a,c-diamide adenosyltransferase [Schwartzia sp. (in: firmicutes)]